jgi:hypothetical protein
MLFYPSKTQDHMWQRPLPVEAVAGRVMVNPNYRVTISRHAAAICDSGAFQDIDRHSRLAPWDALSRQLRFEEQLRWRHGDHDWSFEAVVIYDQMQGVDEAIVNGKKVKQRGTIVTARQAVDETLRAAAYYATQRHRIQGALCFVGQGATPDQYVNQCVLPELDMMQPGDWFAFGGFCIIGRVRSLKPLFMETIDRVLPLLRRKGIDRAHLLGVCVADMVEYAAEAGRREGITMSNDSSAPEFAAAVNGTIYRNGRLIKGPYTKADKNVTYFPSDLALANVKAYTDWAAQLAPAVREPDVLDEEERAQIDQLEAWGVCPVCTMPCGGLCFV